MTQQKKTFKCRKCDCHLERVRRRLIERVLFVRAVYACPWCHRRKKLVFSSPTDSKIEYGGAIQVDRANTIHVGKRNSSESPSTAERSTPTKQRQSASH